MDGDIWEEDTESRHKKRNIFDDDVSIETAKKIITSSPFDDLDDIEDDMQGLDLGNSSAVRYATGSSRTMPDLSSLATPVPSSIPTPASFRIGPALTHSPHSFGSHFRAVGHARSSSLSMVSAGSRPKSGGESSFPKVNMVQSPSGSASSLSIEEAVGSHNKTASMDLDQLIKENQKLKRENLALRRERWDKQPVDITLKRIIKGEPYTLAYYRTLRDKQDLLSQAIQLMDGNAITAAVLHLKRTVRRGLFEHELRQREAAASHYLAYLTAHFQHDELLNTLTMLGRTEEAAIVQYKLACSKKDINSKIFEIKLCLRGPLEREPSLSNDAAFVREHVDLLERQLPIEESDSRLEAEGRSKVFLDFPRRRSLIDVSVTTTLFYSCLYHYHLQENNLASPLAIKKRHQLPERQFLWTAVSARAKARGWSDIEDLLTAKGWFGGKKLKSAIGFERVVEILHKFKAPHDPHYMSTLVKYLELIDDLDVRLAWSHKTNCHRTAIETLVKLRDRAGVEEFARKHGSTVNGEYARRVLRDEAIRWK